jgi:L-fuculokinase
MKATPVIAIFDVGKTNKKLFLFNEQYQIVYEESTQLTEIQDEDGFACEDVHALTQWIRQSYLRVLSLPEFDVKAVNFSAYGASFVHLDKEGNVLTPLYNYLKPYPQTLHDQLYNQYGGEVALSKQTASPVLGSLNSGLQLYRIKYEQPEAFKNIRQSLHLPQYVSFVISGKAATEITSVGCHTLLWDFAKQDYHEWVKQEGLTQKFPPFCPPNEVLNCFTEGKEVAVGIGLHDSSAALIPYLAYFHEPFVLISTGTWCISLNPFNQTLLTADELRQDCLSYLTYQGKAVKASRLFAGNEHEKQTKRLAAHFHKPIDFYKNVSLNVDLINRSKGIQSTEQVHKGNTTPLEESFFGQRDLSGYSSYEEAYHQLMADIVSQQVVSTRLVLEGDAAKKIFVDGGFSHNPIYMHLLATAFTGMEVLAASVAQATAIGAALAIHSSWNNNKLPDKPD